MRRVEMKKTALLTIGVLLLGSVALGDWDPDSADPREATNHKMHWPQMPDLTPDGMDVKTGTVYGVLLEWPTIKVLADDFECTVEGKIRDIHIWGSWKHDEFPLVDDGGGGGDVLNTPIPDPGAMTFHLKIWSDFPDTDDDGPEYSHPDQLLWEKDFFPGEFAVRQYGDEGDEDWFNPNTQEWLDDNHLLAFQYNFVIDENEAFMQEGTVDDPIVYWLSVDVMPFADPIDELEFGWKTSQDHWNDDAVYADWIWDEVGEEWLHGPWREMRYPIGHDFETESIDLAFVITPEPTTMALLAMGSVALIRRRRR